jgi:hypothetical protein
MSYLCAPWVFVHLVYLDDSEESPYQLIGAVIIPELHFLSIENFLAQTIDKYVPEELRDSFEFHASALFHGKEPFQGLNRDVALELLANCASIVESNDVAKVVYGGVNTSKLRSGLYATAQPVDIAFRICMQGIAQWLETQPAPTPESVCPIHGVMHRHENRQIGILICDDTKNQGVKTNLQKAFRAYRRRMKSETHDRGMLGKLHDDMYFGDSSFSVGLQLADVISFIVLRHLQGKEDTESLFKQIEPNIVFGKIEPGLS